MKEVPALQAVHSRSVLDSAAVLPARPGVYRFRDERGRILYVGRAAELRPRVRSYWSELGDRRHLARMVARVARIEAVVCQSRHEAAWLERSMLEHSMPRWNRAVGGQEVPVWLRVSDRGVHVEHRAEAKGELFGPYLGGEQAREAAAALDRVFPLRYANPRSGADRDMGRVLGVLPADRAPMRVAIVAVLSGDRVAVAATLTALTRRRQAFVDGMDFEGAATIQRELDGLTWITEPSRVLDPGPDMDIYGWADGVLLTFELRHGRIRDWHATPCTEPDARARVDSTPDRWRPFTTENAALAAALQLALRTDGTDFPATVRGL